MKKWLLLFALLGSTPAPAASVTCPNGSICMPYVNAGGAVVFNPSATISNATGTAFLAWCHAYYSATASAVTDGGCYNAWSDEWYNITIARIAARDQAIAAAAASAAVVPPAIIPAQ